MAEHQIERVYRERFTRTQHAQDETDRLLSHALDNSLADQRESSARFVAVARPERPLPRTVPLLAREKTPDLCVTARTRSHHLIRNPLAVGPPGGLEVLEGSGLVGVPVLFEVHPASGLGGIAL